MNEESEKLKSQLNNSRLNNEDKSIEIKESNLDNVKKNAQLFYEIKLKNK